MACVVNICDADGDTSVACEVAGELCPGRCGVGSEGTVAAMHEQRRQIHLRCERPADQRCTDCGPMRVDGQYADAEPQFDHAQHCCDMSEFLHRPALHAIRVEGEFERRAHPRVGVQRDERPFVQRAPCNAGVAGKRMRGRHYRMERRRENQLRVQQVTGKRLGQRDHAEVHLALLDTREHAACG